MLCLIGALLIGCSDGSDDPRSTLGVPGAGNPAVVSVPGAALEGPVPGEPVIVSTFFSLASLGYQRAEYFAAGTANAYVNRNEFKPDGRWQVQASDAADYKTRIVVMRPSDPADFNGSVVVEWLNVSAGFDSAPDWGMLHTELIRQGYAWVGVSAQKEGVDALNDGSAAALIPGADAMRYTAGGLLHPGDAYSYDIYSQIAQTLRNPPANTRPLGDLQVERLIAAGESQSADRMMTYVNAFAPLHALFDGYFVHSRLSGSAALQGGLFEEDVVGTPDVVRVRDDLGVPVMMLQTETDLFVLGSWPSNQPDNDQFRLWEVAGTAHADLYTFLDNRFDVGTDPSVAAVVENANPIPGIIECPVAVNAGPQHWVAKAAIAALNRWIVDGTPPPMAERLAVSGEPPAFELDALGNVLGGVRTPYVEAPIAVLSGEGQPQDPFNPEDRNFCFLSGTTQLFDAATLASLYASNADYISAVAASADDAVSKGFLLEEDAALIKTHAENSDIFAPR
tara:strand:- start:8965 stop:10488 length:1524 start_codon:yes stop_codon:yes gene_type:complete